MQLYYGAYLFPINAFTVTGRLVPIFAVGTGRPVRFKYRMTCVGQIYGTGDSNLSTLEQQCRAALTVPYQDLVLLTNAGTPSAERITNAESLSGCKIIQGPEFAETTGPEFVTYRTVTFTAEADFLINGADFATIAFQEQWTSAGNGGPVNRWRFPINGPGVRQQVTPYSLVRTTQSGSAIGHLQYPIIPPARFPDLLVNQASAVILGSPKREGSLLYDWPASWQYQYEGDSPLNALPSLPPL